MLFRSGEQNRWQSILAAYLRLAALDAAPMRVCRLGVFGAVLGAAGIVNAGVAHAITTGSAAGIDYGAVFFGCLAVFLLSVWGYEAAMTLRGRNADRCAVLWESLVAAARDHCVSADALGAGDRRERGYVKALRLEFQTVFRYLEAGGLFQPRLNSYSKRLFGLRCLTDARFL